jgi:hypothetical protein
VHGIRELVGLGGLVGLTGEYSILYERKWMKAGFSGLIMTAVLASSCCKSVTRALQECNNVVTRVLQECYKSVTSAIELILFLRVPVVRNDTARDIPKEECCAILQGTYLDKRDAVRCCRSALWCCEMLASCVTLCKDFLALYWCCTGAVPLLPWLCPDAVPVRCGAVPVLFDPLPMLCGAVWCFAAGPYSSEVTSRFMVLLSFSSIMMLYLRTCA